MKTNGKSETSARATTSARGRLRSESTELCMTLGAPRRRGGRRLAAIAPRHLRENVGEARSGGARAARGNGVGIELAEPREPPLRSADHVNQLSYSNEVH